MNYKGNYTAVHSVPGNVYALEYIPELHTIAAVNISDAEEPSKVMLVNPESGNLFQLFLEILSCQFDDLNGITK